MENYIYFINDTMLFFREQLSQFCHVPQIQNLSPFLFNVQLFWICNLFFWRSKILFWKWIFQAIKFVQRTNFIHLHFFWRNTNLLSWKWIRYAIESMMEKYGVALVNYLVLPPNNIQKIHCHGIQILGPFFKRFAIHIWEKKSLICFVFSHVEFFYVAMWHFLFYISWQLCAISPLYVFLFLLN